jgi:GntR family transcriptional regulator, regulator for abcA and norABC
MQTDYGSSSLSQFAVAEWLSSGLYKNHLTGIRTELLERRNFTINILNTYFKEIVTWNVPKGGFYTWLSMNKRISIHQL